MTPHNISMGTLRKTSGYCNCCRSSNRQYKTEK